MPVKFLFIKVQKPKLLVQLVLWRWNLNFVSCFYDADGGVDGDGVDVDGVDVDGDVVDGDGDGDGGNKCICSVWMVTSMFE